MQQKYKLGAIPDPPDERDYILAAGAAGVGGSYRSPRLPTVFNQAVNNCVNASLSYAYEMRYGKPFSRGFVYGYRPSGYYRGEGMILREALKTVNQLGNVVLPDYPIEREVPDAYLRLLPYISKYKPKANPYKIAAYRRCVSASAINAALQAGMGVVFAAKISSFDTDDRGVFDCSKSPVFGYHAMCIVDFDFDGEYPAPYRVVNSWGAGFGKGGFCYMSAADVMAVNDVWALEFVAESAPKDAAYVVYAPLGNERLLTRLKIPFVQEQYNTGALLAIKKYKRNLAGLASAKIQAGNLKRRGLPVKILDVKG